MSTAEQFKELAEQKYRYGFVTDIEEDRVPKGLSEEIVRLISEKKDEPRVHARVAPQGLPPLARRWRSRPGRTSATRRSTTRTSSTTRRRSRRRRSASMDEVDPELRATFEKLGIPLEEQMRLAGVAVDAVFDCVSVATTYKKKLAELGHRLLLVLRGGARAPRAHREVARLGRAVHRQLLRGAEQRGLLRRLLRLRPEGRPLPDGALDLLPDQREGHRASSSGRSSSPTRAPTSSYLEGCTAPKRDENQLHAAVVELVALDGATIKYSTVQNWYPGDAEGKGGIYNFVTKRGKCDGARRRSAGRRSRPAPPSPGSTRAASSRATTRSASSTRSRSRTTASRPTPARR